MMSGKPSSDATFPGFGKRPDAAAAGDRLVDLPHQAAESVPVLGALDRLDRGPQHPHAVLLEDARVAQRLGEVESGLSAQRREQPVRGAPCRLFAR